MATTIKFTKMQGTGNDYIYVNTYGSKWIQGVKYYQKSELTQRDIVIGSILLL